MLEGFSPHHEADNRWGKKLYAAIDYRSFPRSSTDIDNAFLGNLEAGTLLWWIFASKQKLAQMIVSYINYYSTGRTQRNLSVLTPVGNPWLFLTVSKTGITYTLLPKILYF